MFNLGAHKRLCDLKWRGEHEPARARETHTHTEQKKKYIN